MKKTSKRVQKKTTSKKRKKKLTLLEKWGKAAASAMRN